MKFSFYNFNNRLFRLKKNERVSNKGLSFLKKNILVVFNSLFNEY